MLFENKVDLISTVTDIEIKDLLFVNVKFDHTTPIIRLQAFGKLRPGLRSY